MYILVPFPADYKDRQKKYLVVTGAIFCVIAAILFVIGVGLWIAVGVLVSEPLDATGSKYKSWLPFLSSSYIPQIHEKIG